MEEIIYITLEQAKIVHQKTIQYSGGGTLEHFDLGLLLINLLICFSVPANFIALLMGIKDLRLRCPHNFCFLTGTWLLPKNFLLKRKISAIRSLQERLIKIYYIK